MELSEKQAEQHLEEIKKDNYVDVAKKIGTKTAGNQGFQLAILDDMTAARLYVGSGLTKRFIDLLSNDMTRQWIHIPEDENDCIKKYMNKLGAKSKFKISLKSSLIFGGSLIFMVIDDGKRPDEPVDINNIKSIKKLTAFGRKYVTIEPTDYYFNATLPNYGDPEFFRLTMGNGEWIKVHESRCLAFHGEYYPEYELGASVTYQKYWGLSVLQSLHEVFEDYGIAFQAVLKSFTKFNMDVMKIKNLMQLLASKDGKKQLEARVQIMDLAKSISNTIVLDNDETFEVVAQQLNGVADTFVKIQETVSAMTGVPSNILMGMSVKGLNANGDAELRVYYDKIKSDQEEKLQPQLQRLTDYISMAKDCDVEQEDEYSICFNSLWQETESEKVEMRNKQAETDKIYVELGVVDPNEIRQSRFGDKTYSIETIVEGDAPILPEEDPMKSQDK